MIEDFVTKGKKNISILDRVTSRMHFLKKSPFVILNFRRAYLNYFHVLLQFQNGTYPVNLRLRNGQSMTINSERELWYNMLSQNRLLQGLDYAVDYDIRKEVATIYSLSHQSKAKVLLHNSINNGDVWGIFLKDEYRALPVRGKTVIDIGANIADSSIYFALQGADRIIGIEPFPKNYEMAKENIKINHLTDKITLLLAGCAANSKNIRIDSEGKSDSLSQLFESRHGIEVPLLTLQQILDENDVQYGAILKMDCEGCEYVAILYESKDILQRFSNIQIEYHFGYIDLKKKLQKCGFTVSVSRPSYWKQRETGKSMYTGLIRATIA